MRQRSRIASVIVGAACAAALVVPLLGAEAWTFQGRPNFEEGEGRGYYVWRDGDRWHVRWTTFGATNHFSGEVYAEGGELESLDRIDVDSERHVIAPRRRAHVVVGRRGRVRVAPGRPARVATVEEDHIRMDGDRRIVFSARTDDDIDGFDFDVDDVDVLRFVLRINGESESWMVKAGRNNRSPANNPFVVRLD